MCIRVFATARALATRSGAAASAVPCCTDERSSRLQPDRQAPQTAQAHVESVGERRGVVEQLNAFHVRQQSRERFRALEAAPIARPRRSGSRART